MLGSRVAKASAKGRLLNSEVVVQLSLDRGEEGGLGGDASESEFKILPEH